MHTMTTDNINNKKILSDFKKIEKNPIFPKISLFEAFSKMVSKNRLKARFELNFFGKYTLLVSKIKYSIKLKKWWWTVFF